MSASLDDLPPFVCYRVAAHLTLGELGVLRALNRRWLDLMHADACWNIRCELRYAALLRPFVRDWPGGQPALYEHVVMFMDSHLRVAASGHRDARLVFLECLTFGTPDERRVTNRLVDVDIDNELVSAAVRQTPCYVLADCWHANPRHRPFTWGDSVRVRIVLFVSELMCREIPQFSREYVMPDPKAPVPRRLLQIDFRYTYPLLSLSRAYEPRQVQKRVVIRLEPAPAESDMIDNTNVIDVLIA